MDSLVAAIANGAVLLAIGGYCAAVGVTAAILSVIRHRIHNRIQMRQHEHR